jgi:hypothetical protein
VKRILPGLALLGAVAAVMMRTDSASERTSRPISARPEAPPEVKEGRAATAGTAASETPEPARARSASPVQGAVEPSRAKAVPVPTPWALLGALDRTLKLTELQKKQAEEIFRERNRKVDEYGQEVARRGWGQLKDFDLRVGDLRDASYHRFAAILDVAQAAEFARQVAAGIPEDHLSIELPDGLVLLD